MIQYLLANPNNDVVLPEATSLDTLISLCTGMFSRLNFEIVWFFCSKRNWFLFVMIAKVLEESRWNTIKFQLQRYQIISNCEFRVTLMETCLPCFLLKTSNLICRLFIPINVNYFIKQPKILLISFALFWRLKIWTKTTS